jgi:hypothetical protein
MRRFTLQGRQPSAARQLARELLERIQFLRLRDRLLRGGDNLRSFNIFDVSVPATK